MNQDTSLRQRDDEVSNPTTSANEATLIRDVKTSFFGGAGSYNDRPVPYIRVSVLVAIGFVYGAPGFNIDTCQ